MSGGAAAAGPDLDRRLTPATDRVAHVSLRGALDRPAYSAGQAARVAVPLADLMAAPAGRRDRQLLFGADVTVIDRHDGWSFVQAALDGYCGWIADPALGSADAQITHRVVARSTHLYAGPDMKRPDLCALSMGARLSIGAVEGGFARLSDREAWVPAVHIGDRPAGDPGQVALALLGTPYLWGGNSAAGIDCSGLAQAALAACGLPCPGDSDLQRRALPAVTGIHRGDLLFWPGHVALALSGDEMIHATAWRMSVIREPIADAITRIAAQGDGPFLDARRPDYPHPVPEGTGGAHPGR